MNMVDLKDLSACRLTDVRILPHYSKFLNRCDHFEEKCVQYEHENGCCVVRLNDGEGVFINESNVVVVR